MRSFFSLLFTFILIPIVGFSQAENGNIADYAPVASDVSAATVKNTNAKIHLVASDADFDSLTYSIVSDPSNGTATLSGDTVTYTPSTDFSGTDTFTFKASDGSSDSATKTVTVKVIDGYLSTATQIGTDLDGSALGDWQGYSVSFNEDHTIMAVGAVYRNTSTGTVRVYSYNGTAWSRQGSDLDGESGDWQGSSVSLSSDGTILAVGAERHGSSKGMVRVYSWNGTKWSRQGSDLDGEADGDWQGSSVSLSSDGTTLAVGAERHDSDKGTVRVYSWNGTKWSQQGIDLDGEADDYQGISVSLSSDGTTLAVGAYGHEDSSKGTVRVYSWNGTAWSRQGIDLDGEAGDYQGISVSLSSDGTILAVGAHWHDSGKGTVRVYSWNGTAWSQEGSDLDGEADDFQGISVSLSSDGTTLAVGAYTHDSDKGTIRVYRYNGTAWSQEGSDLDGEAYGDYQGRSVSLSSDGTTLTVGADGHDSDNKGTVRVYNLVNANVPVASFISTWAIETGDFKFPLQDYADITIDWGDDSTSNHTDGVFPTHSYASSATFTIKVTVNDANKDIGKMWMVDNQGSAKLIRTVENWGEGKWSDFDYAYSGATNLTITANDEPDLSLTTDMDFAFRDCTSLVGTTLNDWDVSTITTMYATFFNAESFNADISAWNISKVTDMGQVFRQASAFNQDISSWDTSAVTSMKQMFYDATAFNGNISGWDTSKVVSMWFMFYKSAFNQDISSWVTSAVTNMSFMFNSATAFNQDIGSWDTSKVVNMENMFYLAAAFNKDINLWDTSKVTDMDMMFRQASAFNQDISSWDTSKVTSMSTMFGNAIAFNGNISSWDTAAVTDMQYMFWFANAFNQNISSWNTAAVTNMSSMFQSASAFNQALKHDGDKWNLANVTNMTNMFNGASLSTANYDVFLYSQAQNSGTNENITITVSSKYSDATSRNFLINSKSWIINDEGASSSNNAPVVTDQTVTTIEDIPLNITLVGTDSDGDTLTYSIVVSPTNGTTKLDGNKVTYTPKADYFGSDSFTFKANDGELDSAEATVTINITSNDLDEDGVLNDNDECPNTPSGSIVNIKGCIIFTLPVDNNKVEITSATCIGTTDGSLGLSIEDNSFNYSINTTGTNFGMTSLISGENKTVSITGLAKGTYTVCFKVDGQADYEQCFEVVIGEPKALSAFIDVDNDKRTTNIQLAGSTSYNIDVNGKRHQVKGDNFNTVLPTGLSIIKISTNLECQGVIEREIFISEDIFYYPNPTRGEVDVFVHGQDTGVKMSVFTTKGDLVFTRDQEILDSRKTELDLSGVPAGTYLVTLEGQTVRKTFKIVKR